MATQKLHKNPRPNRRDIERYRRFAEAYLDLSNPETYLKADRSAAKAGYSQSYAFHRGYELLSRVGVQKEIKRIRDARMTLSTIATPEEILESLTQQLRTLPNELVNQETGDLIPLKDMTRDQAQAIAGVKETRKVAASGDDVTTETKLEYKLVDRQKAAEMLAKHHGLYEKDNEQQKPAEGTVKLVMMPTGDLTLEEWTRQVEALNAARSTVDAQ
jgi:phage terminase small subunit